MNVSVAPKRPTVRDQVTPEEWQARVDLAACYRLAVREGWDDLIFTHMSVRVPGGKGEYLTNAFGLTFEEITASNLVKLAPDGTTLLDVTGLGYNKGGFVIHGAVHEAREDAQCVIHLHTVAGVAVSCQSKGLLPIQQGAMMITHDLAYHEYEGVALDLDERQRLVANLGNKNYLILRSHGLLTVGASVPIAFTRMYALHRSCEIQIAAQAGGAELITPHTPVRKKVEGQSRPGGGALASETAWPALLRRLDRIDPGYKN